MFFHSIVKIIITGSLLILSKMWTFTHQIRLKYGRNEKMPVPVVCVGNITLGGAGKTPVVIYLAKFFKGKNVNVHVVSRGYGGNFKNLKLVNPLVDSARLVGDEPLLISKLVPVWVSKKKRNGILAAHKAGAKIILLDDGFQNFSIKKDINILVLDAEFGLKNEEIFPLGKLRETLNSGLRRADFVITIGNKFNKKNLLEDYNSTKTLKIIRGKILFSLKDHLNECRAIAFCGIGRPEKFFSMIEGANVELIEKHFFPDHHFYSKKQLLDLIYSAKKNNAKLITTEKDYVKIPEELRSSIYPVPISLRFYRDEILLEALENLIL